MEDLFGLFPPKLEWPRSIPYLAKKSVENFKLTVKMARDNCGRVSKQSVTGLRGKGTGKWLRPVTEAHPDLTCKVPGTSFCIYRDLGLVEKWSGQIAAWVPLCQCSYRFERKTFIPLCHH